MCSLSIGVVAFLVIRLFKEGSENCLCSISSIFSFLCIVWWRFLVTVFCSVSGIRTVSTSFWWMIFPWAMRTGCKSFRGWRLHVLKCRVISLFLLLFDPFTTISKEVARFYTVQANILRFFSFQCFGHYHVEMLISLWVSIDQNRFPIHWILILIQDVPRFGPMSHFLCMLIRLIVLIEVVVLLKRGWVSNTGRCHQTHFQIFHRVLLKCWKMILFRDWKWVCHLCLAVVCDSDLLSFRRDVFKSSSVWCTCVSDCLKCFFSQLNVEVVDFLRCRHLWLHFSHCMEKGFETLKFLIVTSNIIVFIDTNVSILAACGRFSDTIPVMASTRRLMELFFSELWC